MTQPCRVVLAADMRHRGDHYSGFANVGMSAKTADQCRRYVERHAEQRPYLTADCSGCGWCACWSPDGRLPGYVAAVDPTRYTDLEAFLDHAAAHNAGDAGDLLDLLAGAP